MEKLEKSKVKLGNYYRDPITGFEGMAISKTEWLYGCTRFALQGPVNKEGKVPESEWFDELQLESKEPNKKIGGPPCCGKETG